MNQWLPALISAILGGGLVQAISTIYKSIVEGRKEKVITEAIGVKTPLETESMALSNMSVSLQAAEARIIAMQRERTQDQEYYTARIEELQNRVGELTRLNTQIVDEHARAMANIKAQLERATRETHEISSELQALKNRNDQPPRAG